MLLNFKVIMVFDDFSKQIFKDKFRDAVKTEVKVGTLEKSFDILIFAIHQLIQQSPYLPAIFKQFELDLLEYKGPHDGYQLIDILKFIGDFCYFSYNQNFTLRYALTNCCLFFIIANKTPFKDQFDSSLFQQESEPGFYSMKNFQVHIKIIVLDELDISKKENCLLLLLASAKKFQSFILELNKDVHLIQELKRYI